MVTYKVNANTVEQNIINAFFSALNIKFKIEESEDSFSDDTAYLTSKTKNKKVLDASIKELKEGKTTKIDAKNLWN